MLLRRILTLTLCIVSGYLSQVCHFLFKQSVTFSKNSIIFVFFSAKPCPNQYILFHLYTIPVHHSECLTTEPLHTRGYQYFTHHQWGGVPIASRSVANSKTHSKSQPPRTAHSTKCLKSGSLQESLTQGFRATWLVEGMFFRKNVYRREWNRIKRARAKHGVAKSSLGLILKVWVGEQRLD